MDQLEKTRAWFRIFRDFLIVCIGASMLVHETFWSHNPNLYIIGGGLTALGIPPVLRFDEMLRRSGEE